MLFKVKYCVLTKERQGAFTYMECGRMQRLVQFFLRFEREKAEKELIRHGTRNQL
jgi:hypothetical protein